MPIRVYKPTGAGRRNASVNTHAEVARTGPEKSLVRPLTKNGGRNNQGKITVRGRGGGASGVYLPGDRLTKRKDREGVAGTVVAIE